MNNASAVVERIVIPHGAFKQADTQLEQLFVFAQRNEGAEGMAILGESGTGKTTLLESFMARHKSHRNDDGMEVPVLFASVPSSPTVRSLAGEMLRGFGAPDWDKGTELQMSKRLQVLMKGARTHMVMIDEFNHFYDRGKNKIMYNVADWLKKFIDDTRKTLVVAGLPACKIVVNQNEQLARRFLAPIELPRFDWRDIDQRRQFIGILGAFHAELSKKYRTPEFQSEQMAFRFYCATGGLIGYLAKVLRVAERNALFAGKHTILLKDLNAAHLQAIWSRETVTGLPKPFEASLMPIESSEILQCVGQIGKALEPLPKPTRSVTLGRRTQSINSRLVA
jgi:GTPase SAR1 family protein